MEILPTIVLGLGREGGGKAELSIDFSQSVLTFTLLILLCNLILSSGVRLAPEPI